MSKRSHSQTDDLHNPELFEVVNRYYRCIVCIRHLPQLKADAVRHENSVRHVEALRARDGDNSDNNTENENNAMPSTQRLTPNFSPPSVHGPALACDRPDQLYHSCSPKPPPIIQETILLGALETMEQGYQMTALDLGTLLQAPEWSSGSPAPSSESSTTSSSDTEARITDVDRTPSTSDCNTDSESDSDNEVYDQLLGMRRPRLTSKHDPDWAPWHSKQACIQSVPMAFPRHAQSQSAFQGISWMMEQMGVQNVLSLRTIIETRRSIESLVGTNPREEVSLRCHRYTCASIATILRHEVANPEVRRHLILYPDDEAKRCCGPWHADRWRREVPSELSGPMVRVPSAAMGGQDFYVQEPCLIQRSFNDVAPVIPIRWFTRRGKLFGQFHHLEVEEGVYMMGNHFEAPIDQLLLSYPLFLRNHHHYKLPSPTQVKEFNFDAHENIWRVKALGKVCLTLPLWIYCDDTSGNISKKWNCHNSVLFALAGLPSTRSNLPFDIHFVTTSKELSPTELFAGVVAELRCLRQDGLIAYDCVLREEVLFIPWAYACQGDNPMQSELSSHIGLNGNFFCRICYVHRADKAQKQDQNIVIQSAIDFMQEGLAHSKNETIKQLESQLDTVLHGYTSKLETLQREHGVKDKYFTMVVEKWNEEVNKQMPKKKGVSAADRERRVSILKEQHNAMPDAPFNPLLQIDDFDPNSDTPIEILHVILLGIVKYFWRDAVSRLSSTRGELIARLLSVDTTGLGFHKLRGKVLVQYAGSLIGRDFRAIIQVAPIVLHGLLPTNIYEAWLALNRVTPLAFQHEINDIDQFCTALAIGIRELLKATARWSLDWFNKPKFHLLTHLPSHIRRFGPAPFFATEGFESQNAVIRLQSVHSNRSAPSKDIANGFSFIHAVRHLVCGGYYIGEDGEARQAGERARALFEDKRFRAFIGASKMRPSTSRVHLKRGVIAWNTSMAHRYSLLQPVQANHSSIIQQCQSFDLPSNDTVKASSFIIYAPETSSLQQSIARVLEMLHLASGASSCVYVLIQLYAVAGFAVPYRCPVICPKNPEMVELIEAKRVRAVINTFHNCAQHECVVRPSEVMKQERSSGFLKEDRVIHTIPNDFIVNLGQFRSAALLSPYCANHPFHELSLRECAELGYQQKKKK